MATLVHDDLIDRAARPPRPRVGLDGARPRRRARRRRLPLRPRVRRARRPGDVVARRACSPTPRSPSRAARRCSGASAHDPDDAGRGLPRALRAEDGQAVRGRLPARRRQRRRSRLGLASASPSRSPTTSSTARATRSRRARSPGTDLREGTPTLPLLLAAREDEVVRGALAGGPLEGALVRVAATGALERVGEVALDYARRARASLTARLAATSSRHSPTPSSTGALTVAVLDRTSTLDADPREGRGRRAARPRGRPRAARVGRPARARRARRPRAPRARRHATRSSSSRTST